MRVLAISMVVLVWATMARAAGAEQQQVGAEEEFRAAWAAFAEPARGGPESRTLEGRQQARMEALGHIEAAVAQDAKDARYQTSLAYIALAAGKYARGREAVERAIELKRDDPALYLLRGQAEAALAQMEPDRAGERIGPALRAFDDAAKLDPTNSLPLLQGASVAFDVGREDLAMPMVKRALERERFVLHRLPAPDDLGADTVASLQMWQYIQLSRWLELLARCENVSRALIRVGERKAQEGDESAAEEVFRDALQVGRRVGVAEPGLFLTTNAAMNLMENAYLQLAQLAELRGSREAERWRGEIGVVAIGRGELFGALERYLKDLEEGPPGSVEELLACEAKWVKRTIMGIGLTPPGPTSGAEPEAGEQG